MSGCRPYSAVTNAKQFAKVLANVQKQGLPVKWLAHSQGGLIFTKSVHYLGERNHTDRSLNSVQFDAGANNEVKTKQILLAACRG